MHDRPSFFRWAPFLFAVLLSVFVGVAAYNAGVSHSVVVATTTAAAPAGAPAQIVMPYYGWPHFGWHPFGFVFPVFFFLFLWLVIARAAFFGRYRRHCYGYPGGDGPTSFDEWHRQAHERMNTKST